MIFGMSRKCFQLGRRRGQVMVATTLVLWGVGIPFASGAGGSTRLKDIEESQFKDMVEDIGAHDGDQSGSLDGLEIFKSVLHSHTPATPPPAPGGWAAENPMEPPEMTIPQEHIDATTSLVDDLLDNHDWNMDGLLDFSEFMSCFSENKEKLNV
ncbi:uncharacterized protein LOC131883928 isoform X2 [Tigriopus californicus]|uniref:uncharacterized protein LOC131883928 isoform X2 n=1 Tax=Tigriopus californicus TaxID=6832 RepID=UPI0027DA8B5B|nr:uncharacterized protein LOC131883928 isoform X2 [Tigriopus californicus]